jgi:hypothetical protein
VADEARPSWLGSGEQGGGKSFLSTQDGQDCAIDASSPIGPPEPVTDPSAAAKVPSDHQKARSVLQDPRAGASLSGRSQPSSRQKWALSFLWGDYLPRRNHDQGWSSVDQAQDGAVYSRFALSKCAKIRSWGGGDQNPENLSYQYVIFEH